ncbi:peptidoglycan/LPS O-acetylase OafA/YrhL [Kutzneria kofuensis]|uniref:Peptidoglycan/LPS O-acetylase OafA/YrhL n=1 Tax=Kutzneria kofuensis TaxID=103725 RepID=A0A7W9KPV1_9PSEU|nr:peptidoglycan/LPS O-acetylase OafA/YrhL [Kutzneria kofuensis]
MVAESNLDLFTRVVGFKNELFQRRVVDCFGAEAGRKVGWRASRGMAGLVGYDTYRRTKVFASLNGLRCLSILAVIWHHCGGDVAGIPVPRTGYLGVSLFFVISGFLITTLLLRERDQHGQISLRRFYARRSLRIFPLYYTVVAIYAVLVLLVWKPSAYGNDYLHNLPAFLTYTSNWFVPLGSELYLAWSLAAEEQFYLVWPVIERFTARKWPVLLAVAILMVSVALSTPAATVW